MSKHICETLLDYVSFLGVQNIESLPGLWENQIDKHWKIKCNGHAETIDNVPALCWRIEFNGWPAGILSVIGEGVICGGDEANAENLQKAIEAKMSQDNIQLPNDAKQ